MNRPSLQEMPEEVRRNVHEFAAIHNRYPDKAWTEVWKCSCKAILQLTGSDGPSSSGTESFCSSYLKYECAPVFYTSIFKAVFDMIFALRIYPGLVQLLIQDVFLLTIQDFHFSIQIKTGQHSGKDEYEDTPLVQDPYERLPEFPMLMVFQGWFDRSGEVTNVQRQDQPLKMPLKLIPSEKKFFKGASSGGLGGYLFFKTSHRDTTRRPEYARQVRLSFSSSVVPTGVARPSLYPSVPNEETANQSRVQLQEGRGTRSAHLAKATAGPDKS